MTSRQARNIRREQERKAKKAEYKANRVAAASTVAPGPPITAGVNPELLDEFTPQFLAHANSMRERIQREVAAKMQNRPSSPDSRFVSQSPATEPASVGFLSQNAPQPDDPRSQPAADSAPPASRRSEINRANAQHSTGPRTSTGKLASSRNSLKHGLASGTLIIPGEDQTAFDALLNDLLAEHAPVDTTEEILIHEIAQSFWLAQRALRFQNDCFTEAGVDEKRLSLFLRYHTTHERAFHTALNTLMRLQKDRRKLQLATARGFVSRANASTEKGSGFVSQNGPSPAPESHFESQNPLSPPLREAA